MFLVYVLLKILVSQGCCIWIFLVVQYLINFNVVIVVDLQLDLLLLLLLDIEVFRECLYCKCEEMQDDEFCLGIKFIYINCLLFIIMVKVVFEENVECLGINWEQCLVNYK